MGSVRDGWQSVEKRLKPCSLPQLGCDVTVGASVPCGNERASLLKGDRMTFKELHDLIPKVVADNMGQIQDAERYANELAANSESPDDIESVKELMVLIENRKHQIERFQSGIQNSIHQLAIFAHAAKGFDGV